MGRETALQIAARFRNLREIWLIARSEPALYQLQKELSKRGVRGIVLAGDLTDSAFLEMLRERLHEEHPGIACLVNASGFGKVGDFAALPEKAQADMVSLNCTALLRLCRISMPYLLDGYGRILNFASAAAFLPQPHFAVYAATKAFVLSLSESLAEELRPRRITVTAICPGPVRTAFFSVAEEFYAEPLYKRIFYADPHRVVKKALRDSLHGKVLSVYGASMQFVRILSHILPHRFLFAAMSVLNTAPKARRITTQPAKKKREALPHA